MRRFLLLLALAACASPAPEMMGATRSEVVLQGITFVVFHKESRAEVVRMGYLSRHQRAAVQDLMIRAVEQATGCQVRAGSFTTGLPGDTGEARMALAC